MLKLLLVNTGSNVLVMVVKLAITFIMTPILVSNLGKYDYGLWEMVAAVIGYMGLFDMGVRPAISRYAAKYAAVDDRDNLLVVYSSTFFFMAVVGILLLVFFLLWGSWYGMALAPEGAPGERYVLLLMIIGAQLVIVFPGYVAESYLEGFQKYYLKNNITIFNSLVGSLIIYLYITPENGLLLLAGCNAIGLSVKYLVFMWLLAREKFGAIKISLGNFSFSKLKEILVFSSKSFVQGISGRVENGTDSLIIGYFLGPAVVPFYSIPANLVHYIRTLGWTLTHAFMPLFSGMSARSEDGNMRDVYLIASKYVLAIILALAVGVSIVGGPFLILWLGPEFREKSDIIIILLVIFTAGPFINPFASRYLTAIGKHGIFAYLSPLSALINIGLSLALVHRYGIVGVAFASTVSVFICNPIYLWYACKHLMLPVRHYLKVCFLPSLVPAVVLGAIVLQFRLHGGLEAYPMLLTSVLVSGFAWLVAFWFLALRSGEREFILARIRGRQSGSYPCPSVQIEDRPNPRSID